MPSDPYQTPMGRAARYLVIAAVAAAVLFLIALVVAVSFGG
jgi:hypothetical protein